MRDTSPREMSIMRDTSPRVLLCTGYLVPGSWLEMWRFWYLEAGPLFWCKESGVRNLASEVHSRNLLLGTWTKNPVQGSQRRWEAKITTPSWNPRLISSRALTMWTPQAAPVAHTRTQLMMEIWEPGNGDLGIGRSGDLKIQKFGDLGAWKSRNVGSKK